MSNLSECSAELNYYVTLLYIVAVKGEGEKYSPFGISVERVARMP
jgi:hypothetical protein